MILTEGVEMLGVGLISRDVEGQCNAIDSRDAVFEVARHSQSISGWFEML